MNALSIVKNIAVDNLEALSARIEATRAKGLAASREVERLEAAKLQSDDRETFDKLARDSEWQKVLIARCSRELQSLEAQLRMAKDEKRRVRWQKLVREHDINFAKVINEFASAYEAFLDLNVVLLLMQNEGFGTEMASLTRLPHLNNNPFIAPDLVQAAIDQAARSNPKLARKFPTSAGRIPETLRRTKTPVSNNAKGRVALGVPPVAPTPTAEVMNSALLRPVPQPVPRAADDWSPLGEGEVRVIVTRAGYSPSHACPQCRAGQVIKLKRDDAEAATLAGAVELISEVPADGS